MYILNWKGKYLCDVVFLYSLNIHTDMIHCFKSRTMKNLIQKKTMLATTDIMHRPLK